MNDLVVKTLKNIERKSKYMFCDEKTGKPYYSIKTAFGKALKRAGLIRSKIPRLRHTACSAIVANGIDLVTIKEILGHASLSTVLRYTHPISDEKRVR